MKKLLWVCLLAFSVFGADITWNSSYDQALLKAKKEGKPLMVLITSEQCRWCRKLEATTLQDDEVVARINTTFQAVNVIKDKSIYPKNLSAKMVPMSYFLDPKTGKVLYSIPGYWGAEDYNSILDDALRKYKK
ncbi:MAG: thioredoxin family protein [Sulfuricurvum sp.]|nr:thioredoxin family protein [Sulfuricurvum sp.]MDP3466065.1 thioredoxin family protein [Sulfuricurvum sp.]